MTPKPYAAKSLPAAQRRVRNLLKQREHMHELLERIARNEKAMSLLLRADHDRHWQEPNRERDRWPNAARDGIGTEGRPL